MTQAQDMTVRALAPWFGGKRTLAADICAELGPHTQFFEPFCGSMSVLLQKEPSQKETVNDLHGDLVNLARVIQRDGEAQQLYNRLQSALMCEGLLDEAKSYLDDDSALSLNVAHENIPAEVRIERAYWYFIASWMGRNGTAGTERLDYQIAVRWTVNGGSPTVRFRNALESLPAWHRRLRNVVIIRRDAFSIIPRFEDVAGTVIYADPPYPFETRSNGLPKAGGGGRYLHEFNHTGGTDALFDAKADDHTRLADQLRAFKHARIVVSSYDCPRYRDLYKGWTFVAKTMNKNLHAQNGRGARPKEAPEVLIMNGQSLAGTDVEA